MSSYQRRPPADVEGWKFGLQQSVSKATSLLVELLEEQGRDLAFSPQSPEASLVRNVLQLVYEHGGAAGLDAVCLRIQRHMAEDELDPDGDVLAALGQRIAEVVNSR